MSKTILHIDDEADIRELVAAYLTAKSYRVLSAATRAEALKFAERDKPQLVICDLQLDESDGLQAIAEVKAILPHVPVILFTGMFYDPGIARSVMPSTIDAYIGKTAPLPGLLAEVERLLA